MKIAMFSSIRHVTKADMACRQAGIMAPVVAIPREITQNCGLGLRIEEASLSKFEDEMARRAIPYIIEDYQ